MSYLSSAERAWLTASLQKKEEQLTAANDAYDKALENADISSYTFDSGEAKQSTFRRKPAEIQQTIIQLENQIDRLRRRLGLTSGGVVSMNLRRR